MKTITFTKDALVTGENALEYLKTLKCKKAKRTIWNSGKNNSNGI